MPRLDRLPRINRDTVLQLPVQLHDDTPFAPPAKPLAACRVSIVTTAGLHRRGDRVFGPADPSYRVIPSATPAADLVQSHTSLGFDRTPTMRDVNVSFPVDRLLELVERRVIGGLGPNHYSFMGAQRDVTRIERETAPAVGRRLREEGVDVALVTPT